MWPKVDLDHLEVMIIVHSPIVVYFSMSHGALAILQIRF
jgi:hypothetical protein